MLRAYRQYGWAGLWARASDALGDHRPIGQFYDDWIKLYDTPSEAVSRRMKVDLAKWSTVPLITVLMPLNQGDVAQTLAAIDSCRAQLYPRWELLVCLGGLQSPSLRKMLLAIAQRDVDRIRVVDADPDDGVCAILNNALADAAGEHFVLLENSATLSEYALFWVAREITQHPTVDLIFSDEDRLSDDGQRCDVKFKSDWNPALMLSCNAFGHLGAYRKSLVGKVGGFSPGVRRELRVRPCLALRSGNYSESDPAHSACSLSFAISDPSGLSRCGHRIGSIKCCVGNRAQDDRTAPAPHRRERDG